MRKNIHELIQMRRTKRSWKHQNNYSLAGGIVLSALLLPLFGCGGSETGQEAGEEDRRRQLVIDTQLTYETGDPHRENFINDWYILALAYDTLLTYEPTVVDGRLQYDLSGPPGPSLASSYEVDDSGQVFTFNLRTDAVFSDGTPVTAEDVVFSLNRIRNLKGAPSYITANFERVEASDEHTVVIHTTKPTPELPALLASEAAHIVNSTVAQEHGATAAEDAAEADTAQSYFDSNSLGSGPYVIDSFSPTTQTVLLKNERYWGEEPYYERIVFRNVQAEVARLNLQNGRTDIALNITPDQATTLKDDASLQVVQAPSATVFYLQATAKEAVSEVTSNPAFWEAVRYAIDYDSMVDDLGGEAVQACGVVPRQVLGALPAEECVERDLDRARSALERAGIEDPQVELEFPTEFQLEGVVFQTMAEAVQRDLREIGIDASLRGSPSSTWLPRWQDALQEMNQGALAMLYADPAFTLVYLPTGYRGQYAGWQEGDVPELQALGERAAVTLDPTARAELYREFQRAMNEASPIIPQVQPTMSIAATGEIEGLAIHPVNVIDAALLHERSE